MWIDSQRREAGGVFRLAKKRFSSENASGESDSTVSAGIIETSPKRRSVMSCLAIWTSKSANSTQSEVSRGSSGGDLAVADSDDDRQVSRRDPVGGLLTERISSTRSYFEADPVDPGQRSKSHEWMDSKLTVQFDRRTAFPVMQEATDIYFLLGLGERFTPWSP